MNDLTYLPSVEDIFLDVDAADRQSLFATLGAMIGARHGLGTSTVADALNVREALDSTALGAGVAIPHAKVEGLDHAIVAFARSKSAIDFAAPDGEPVRLFFFLLAPLNATAQHIEILSELAALLCRPALRDLLGAATTPKAVADLLKRPPPEALAA